MRAWIVAGVLGFFSQAKDHPQQGQGAEVGSPAPDWKLKSQDGKSEAELAKLRGKPAVLIFGSYT
jgi:hypothetical protein